MMIRNMFQEDINRQINGVIKVDQSSADVIEQEVKEYVITKELKRHFMQFLTTMMRLLRGRLRISAYGYPAFSEVANRISLKCFHISWKTEKSAERKR